MNVKLKHGLLLCYILLSGNIVGQVTIGLGEEPIRGALLQLKDKPNIVGSEANSTKGLGLPIVELTNLKPKTKEELAKSIGNTTGSYDLDNHTGLLIYNITQSVPKQCALIPEGLYVWNGEEWQMAFDLPEIKRYTDYRAQVLGTQVYYFRDFGDAGEWMVENLRYLPLDGSITLSDESIVSNGDQNAKVYSYPSGLYGYTTSSANPHASWNPTQGLLYSYSAVTLGAYDGVNGDMGNNPNEPELQGICPPGWHVPSDYEWSQLEEEICKHPEKYSSETTLRPWRDRLPGSSTDGDDDDYEQIGNRGTHGEIMKSLCLMPNIDEPLKDTMAKGYPIFYGGFGAQLTGAGRGAQTSLYGESAVFWTSSHDSWVFAWFRSMFSFDLRVQRSKGARYDMFSVRCKR
ncbi:MAG: fibrobacter succinogenes major paralogous domain-containing protein [Prevotella sp.]|jgi:uncharacterized protein (TIGR02145 family)|nr:fibrobacter succinogenes major paralogous domain-containing protein [Prevotella sp.]